MNDDQRAKQQSVWAIITTINNRKVASVPILRFFSVIFATLRPHEWWWPNIQGSLDE
jgi:hypothetical protein